MKDYTEMVTDDVDKVIRTGEYDYIIKNCKTEKELKDRLYFEKELKNDANSTN